MMVFGLIEQADRIGKSALATQRELATQIQQLAQVQAGIQTAIQELAAERSCPRQPELSWVNIELPNFRSAGTTKVAPCFSCAD